MSLGLYVVLEYFVGRSITSLHGFQTGLPGRFTFLCARDLQGTLAGSIRQLGNLSLKGFFVPKENLAYEVVVLPLYLLFLSVMICSDGLLDLTLSNDDYQ